MPRKAHIVKREIVPDPVHQSTLLSKFVNCMMYGGKKSTAQGIIYGALGIIEQKTGEDPMKLFKKAVENCKPLVEVKTRRVGGANYQVPVEVRPGHLCTMADGSGLASSVVSLLDIVRNLVRWGFPLLEAWRMASWTPARIVSLGDRGRLQVGNRGDLVAGAVQWMTAGRGIIHSEMPQQSEGRMRGFQLWVNLPAAEKMKPAWYRDIEPQEIPQVRLADGGSAR